MLTQRATLLGFIAFCFYLIAVVNTLPGFYYVLMWLALGLLAASLGIAVLSLSGLDFAWNIARSTGTPAALASGWAMAAANANWWCRLSKRRCPIADRSTKPVF